MRSVVRRKSYGSVQVFWVDEEALTRFLEELTAWYPRFPEVEAVVLFGSLAKGMFSVGSDVDLLLILRESRLAFPDRMAVYLPDHAPVDVQVFPYTVSEIREGQPFACEALSYGKVLWQRPGFSVEELKKACP
ncbi:MAG: nucleotidyltransferase domain-containing protein [Thermoflexus sp.]|nr:nucleotidyltransferase domain-containing protein [Thermoflexus sp.]